MELVEEVLSRCTSEADIVVVVVVVVFVCLFEGDVDGVRSNV